jgi:hypothetical protein
MSEARIELSSMLSKIHALIQSIPTLEQRKATAYEYYEGMKVGYDEYGNRRITDALLPSAERINKVIQTELAAQVELEYAERCQAVANEIDALRVTLPGLAAQACVEIGALSRDIAARRLTSEAA